MTPLLFVLTLQVLWHNGVLGHGAIAFPPVQLAAADDGYQHHAAPKSKQRAGLDGRGAFRGISARSSDRRDNSPRQDGSDGVHKGSARTSTRDANSVVSQQIDEDIPDCGESRIDVEPVDVTSATAFRWRSDDVRGGGVDVPVKVCVRVDGCALLERPLIASSDRISASIGTVRDLD